MSPKTLAIIWEVYARLGLRPEQACHLLRRQGVFIPPSRAKDQMHRARRRNLLRLVSFKGKSNL